MSKIEIFGFPESTYVRAVRMACEEKAIAYDLTPVRPHSPEVLAIHPFGKIPAMRHGDFELFESKAIATYLDLTFPGPRLIPTDGRSAALAEQWISLVNSVMDMTMIRTYLFAYLFPKTEDGQPDRKIIDATTPTLQEQVGILDKGVSSSGYLAGDSLTFADLNLMPILFYIQKCPEGAAAVADAKHLKPYYERLAARPSFTRTAPPPRPATAA